MANNHAPPTDDEHTALLPESRRLSPQDPAVSPYNLFSVRALRHTSLLLFTLSLLWWLALFINTFLTIPGLHTSSGGWFGLSFSTLSLGLLSTLLLFYRTPSKTERTLYSGILLFTLASTLLILIPAGIRNTEAWTGPASVLWTLLITTWCIICDRTVQHGTRTEHARLTGSPSHPRNCREFCSVISASTVLAILLAVSLLLTINLSILARDHSLPAPGHLYPIENASYEIHIFCTGNATDEHGNRVPTVLLEGGHDPVELRLESWVREAHEREHTVVKRYCYYDRPGYAFSSAAPSPASAGRVVDGLTEALEKAGETGPWVLVAHGVGGIYARIFAARHPGGIKGIMLIDALPESQLYRIGGAKRGLGLWLRGVLYPLGVERLWVTWFLGRNREERVYGRDAYMRGEEVKAKLQESLVAESLTKNEIVAAAAILRRETPVVVVSSGRRVRGDRAWSDGQRELTGVSDELVGWDVVEGAGSEVWRDNEGRVVLTKRLVELLGGA